MTKRGITGLFSLAVLAVAVPVTAAEWRDVSENYGSIRTQYDWESVTRKDDVVRVMLKSAFMGKEAIMSDTEISCTRRESRALIQVRLDETGKPVERDDVPTGWSAVEEGTIGSMLIERLCPKTDAKEKKQP